MTKFLEQTAQDSVKAQLINGVVKVNFLKSDGTIRKMNATLNENVVPKATKEDPLSTKAVRKVNPEVCVVWDVDAAGWRSFRWDRLQEVKEEEQL